MSQKNENEEFKVTVKIRLDETLSIEEAQILIDHFDEVMATMQQRIASEERK